MEEVASESAEEIGTPSVSNSLSHSPTPHLARVTLTIANVRLVNAQARTLPASRSWSSQQAEESSRRLRSQRQAVTLVFSL